MLELSKIGFTVDTSQLDTAANKLAALGKAASGLAKDFTKLDKSGNETALSQKKLELAAEKVATQAAKTAEITERAEQKKAKAVKETTKAIKEAEGAQLGLVDSIERKRDLISEGWTRGESSILKMAEAMGVAGGEMERLKGLLRDIGGLASNPFDSTLGSLRSIQKEFDGLVLRAKLVEQGIELNSTQLKQFARIAAEASVAVKKMGLDPTEGAGLETYNKLLKESQDAYLQVAVANKSMLDGEKLLAKQHRDTASAKSFLIKEDERMLSVTEQLNTGTNRAVSISEKAAIATANYARALKTAGVNGDEARTRLAKYSAMQQAAAAKEEQRAAANLARALQPQVTDVAVSLWSGQNPLTVMLQQGGQVVDLFKLSGVEASKLSSTMRTAFTGMLPSIVAVGSAVGGLLKDGIVAVGSAFTGLFTEMSFMQKISEMTKRYLVSMGDDGFSAVGRLNTSMKALNTLMGLAAVSALAFFGLLVAEMYKVMKAQSELNVAMAMTGASLGLSSKEAFTLAASMSEVGVSSMKGVAAMTEVAKAGNLEADMFATIAKSASVMEKYTGQSIEDTVKQFSKLAEKPTEALTEIALKTGYVNVEVLAQVSLLEQQGHQIEAVALAQKAYGESNQKIAQNVKDNLSGIERIWFDIKSAIGAVQQVMFDLANNSTALDTLKFAWVSLAVPISELWYLLKSVAKTIALIAAIDLNPASTVNLIKEWASDLGTMRKEQNEYVKGLINGKTVSEEQAKLDADKRKANSDAAAMVKYTNDLTEKGLTSEVKALNKIDELRGRLEDYKLKGLDKTNPDQYKNLVDATEDAVKKQQKIIASAIKTKPDPALKEQENYLKRIQERVKDLGIEINGTAFEFTKADKLKQDLLDDKLWATVPKGIRESIIDTLTVLSNQEKTTKEIKEQHKVQEGLVKLQAESSDFIAKSEEEQRKIKGNYQLQLDLLGKTEEQQKKIKEQAELENKLQEQNFKFEQKKIDLRAKYLKLTQDSPITKMWEIYDEQINEEKKLDNEHAEYKKTLNQGVAVQAAIDYYNEMKKISSDLADIITTALFEGGQAGAKKIRDYLTNFLRKKIEVWIEANIMGAITGQGGNGSGGSGSFMMPDFSGKVASTIGDMGAKLIGGPMDSFGQTLINGSDKIGQFAQTIGESIGYLDSVRALSEGKIGEAAGSAIGNYFSGGNPVVAKIGGEIGKAIDRLFGGGEHVQSTGSATTQFDSKGNVVAKNQFGNSFDFQTKAADAIVEGMRSAFITTANSLGINSSGGAFAYGSNNSDGGKFGINASVGSTRYATTDIKSTPEALQLEASRAVFAALKGSDLPKYLQNVFNGITAETATSAEIDNAIKYAGTLKGIRETLLETRKPIEVLKDNLSKAFVNLGTTADTFKQDFVAAIDAGIGPDALASWVAASDTMASLTAEADKLASTNKSLQDKLDILTGKETERTIQLRDATDESTRELLRQINAQEDLRDAADAAAKAIKDVSFNFEEWMKYDQLGLSNKTQYDAYTKIEDLRKKAADQYFAAQDRVTQAQQQLADALNSTVKSFEDFLSTLDNASTPTERLSTARRNFSDLTTRAQAGDTEAIGQLTTSAKTFLDLSKGYSKSIVDYRRDEAQVRIVLEQGIKAGKEQLAMLPAEIKKSSDPLKLAYEELAKATADEETARTLAIAMQADLSKSEEDLGKLYKDLLKALPKDMGEKLLTFYNDTFAAADAAKQTAQTAAKAAQDILNNLMGPTQGPRPSSGGSVPPTGGGGSSVTNTGKGIRVGDNGLMWIDDKLVWMKDIAAEANLWGNTYGKESATAKLIELGANDSILEELRKYSVGVPMFANGGDHFGGIRLVGEKGPELEATGASRIFSANQTASILGNSDMTDQLLSIVVEKLDTLNKNNTLENNTIITHVKKSAQLLERFDVIGIPTRA